MTVPDPRHTYALVVAVSECDLGSDWDRPGLEKNAADFSAWLRSHGVPDSNISSFTQRSGRRATAVHLSTVLSQSPLLWPPESRFWLYWAGHGVTRGKNDVRLITADATPNNVVNLSLDQILELLRAGHAKGPRHQTVIVDACLTNADDVAFERLNHPFGLPEGGEGAAGLSQDTWIATGLGEAARSTNDQGGLLSAAVLQGLHDGNGLDWCPTPEKLEQLIRDKEAEFPPTSGATQRPIQLVYKDSRGSSKRYTIDREPDRLTSVDGHIAPVTDLLQGWHLPHRWRRGDRRPVPGDAYLARLDVLWYLDRGPVRGIVADSPGIDLADALQSVEFFALRSLASEVKPTQAAPGGQPRLWCTIPIGAAAAGQPPAAPAALGQLAAPASAVTAELAARPDGTGLGLVVRWDDGPARSADPASAADYFAGLARSWPHSAVVLHATAEFPARAMTIAAEAEWTLTSQEPGLRLTLATLVLPAVSDTPVADPGGTRQGILNQIRMRGNPAVGGRGDDFVTEIDELAAQGTPLPQLADAFRDARDLDDLTGEYLAGLRAHAGRGADPARYASLAAAVDRDDMLDAWLSAAAEADRPVVPEDLPAGLLSQDDLDSVVLALLRRADFRAARDVAARWRRLISSGAQHTADHLGSASRARLTPDERAARDRKFLLECQEPYSARFALRAGIGRTLTLGDLCPDDRPSPAAWAMLIHRPLDQAVLRLIVSWPLTLRRVLGFTANGEESAEHGAATLERLRSAHLLLRPAFPAGPTPLPSLEA